MTTLSLNATSSSAAASKFCMSKANYPSKDTESRDWKVILHKLHVIQ